MRNYFFAALGVLTLVSASPARSQVLVPGCPSPGSIPCTATQIYTPVAETTLSVTSTSARVAFPGTGTFNAMLTNTGLKTAYYAVGSIAAVATTSSASLAAGQSVAFPQGANTYVAAIAGGGDTTSLTVRSGTGYPVVVYGSLAVSGGSITPLPATAVTPVVSTSAGSSLVLKASAGSILSLSATSATPGYVMLFDATSAPADGAVTPKYCWQGPVSGPWPTPAAFATGITAVYSTTGCATKTASATAWFSGQVQ